MTTKAIEAGARAIAELRGAIWTRDKSKPVSATFDHDAAKACIEAAIASGALVPAALAAERERCAEILDKRAAYFESAKGHRDWTDAARSYRVIVSGLRSLEPASGDCGWQDISTAPKDGTQILLSFKDSDDEWCVIQGWYENGIADLQWCDIYHGPVEPTHWISFPASPNGRAGT